MLSIVTIIPELKSLYQGNKQCLKQNSKHQLLFHVSTDINVKIGTVKLHNRQLRWRLA